MRLQARRGNLMITAFIFVLVVMMVFAGLDGMLREQLRQSLDIKDSSLETLQAQYLAEMGVNELMYVANQNNSFPTSTQFYDFTNYVAMTRTSTPTIPAPTTIPASYPSQYAYCWAQPVTPPAGATYAMQVQAQLKRSSDSSMTTKIVEFGAKQVNGSQWVLTGFWFVK